ncbi:NAD-dependent epimerase/dehydratase family protein [Roseiflexus sp.]|uniref:NAD-dependent epimerase/dehydratase family protein n=1 Tax=Roseiflexus sp. TaxID=2562120 RepID=UPI00398A5372
MELNVLITGGAGFIGSFLADHFVRRGARVRVLDRLDPQVHPDGKPRHLAADVELIAADVRDKDAVSSALVGVDIVIHAAAAVGVGQSLYRVQHYTSTNAVGMATLLEALIERRQELQKLIVLTSMTGYGEGAYRRPSDGALVRPPIRTPEDVQRYGWELRDLHSGELLEPAPTPEDAALLARNVYALSKRWQEELALSLGELYGFPTTCLRLFNVYGPRQSLSNPYTGVLAIFLSRILNGEAPVVYEDGRQTRDFVSVHDVVAAVQSAIDTPASNGQVFNIGTGIPRRIVDVAETLARLVGRPEVQPQITNAFRKGDIRHCFADNTRARDVLGFTPRVDWETSLLEIAEWCASAPAVDRFHQADRELRLHGLLR